MKILFTTHQIKFKVKELAETINKTHKKDDTPIVMVCLLNGGFMFYTELVKNITVDVECDFMRVKSYVAKREQGDVQITKDLETPIKGKHVYIVDDFFDTGHSMDAVADYFISKSPKSITGVTLLTRDISPIPIYPLLTGFHIQDEWVVGYGLNEEDGTKRNIPWIYSI
jgi:hypoxanthine phosphoribosyltransferase